MREFDTGATRDSDENKLDYEGFLSPRALRRYAEYMHKNRKQADGKMRASDNWQKGIPKDAYMKSLFRHFMDVWALHRAGISADEDLREALCATIFNAFGYLHEDLTLPANWVEEALRGTTIPPVDPDQAGLHQCEEPGCDAGWCDDCIHYSNKTSTCTR